MFLAQRHNSLLFMVLISLFFCLQYQLWLAEDGVLENYSLSNKSEKQSILNQSLLKQNEALERRIAKLKGSKQVLEKEARLRLGFVKEKETFYSYANNL